MIVEYFQNVISELDRLVEMKEEEVKKAPAGRRILMEKASSIMPVLMGTRNSDISRNVMLSTPGSLLSAVMMMKF